MYNTERCPVCKGTGREEHKHVRNDGETIVEQIICELCEGTGRIKKLPREDRYEPKPTFGFGFDKIGYDDGDDF